MNYAHTVEDLRSKTWYNNIKEKIYTAEGYLKDVETVNMDFRELAGSFRDDPSVCYLLDPPYLSTEAGHYAHFWRMADSLDTLPILAQWKNMKSGDYVLGLEPSSCYIMGRERERKEGRLMTLEPFGSVKNCVKLSLSQALPQ